uniref:Protein containing TUDOR domain n=1 Tax=Rhipicephalus zambeziensis TaxID=60191 RepID=A0A224Z0P9_9ACAR
MRQLPNAEQGSGLSKLDRLKAVLEESKRKKAASPQGVLPASSLGASHEKALPNRTVLVTGNSCDEKDVVHTSRTTSPEQSSEKAKKLKELLERQARKRVTVQQLVSSPTPPALDQVSNHDGKGGETSPTALPSSELHSKKDGNDIGVGHFPCSRLPVGMRVPVVFLRLEEDKKVIYLQEMSALRDLVKMVKALNSVVSKEKPLEETVPGDLVAVLHEKDSTWYRGQIGPIQQDEKEAASGDGSKKKVRVWFVDYGRWENVPLDCLCHLPNGYERLPGFAIPVTLHGLKKIKVPKDVKFEGSFFDAEVVTNSDRQSVRLHIRNDDLCLNDTLSVYAESTSDASAA